MLISAILVLNAALAQETGQCTTAESTALFQAGFEAQKSLDTDAALVRLLERALVAAEDGRVHGNGWR